MRALRPCNALALIDPQREPQCSSGLLRQKTRLSPGLGGLLESVAEAQKHRLAPRGAEERQPNRQLVVKRGRHGYVRVSCDRCRAGAAAGVAVAVGVVD